MAPPPFAAFGADLVNHRLLLFHAALPLENLDLREARLEHARVADDSQLQVLVGEIPPEHAQMQRAPAAIVVFKTDRRVVVHLVRAFNDAIDCAAAKSSHALRARAHPPVHEVELVTVLVHETTARAAIILNPILRFFLKRMAEFPAPRHARLANVSRVHQLFDPLKVGRVTEFVADHDDTVGLFRRAQQPLAFLARDAAGFLQEQMLARLQRFQSERHMSEIGRGDKDRVQRGLNQLGFVCKQLCPRRAFERATEIDLVARANGGDFSLLAAEFLDGVDMTHAHDSQPGKTNAQFHGKIERNNGVLEYWSAGQP